MVVQVEDQFLSEIGNILEEISEALYEDDVELEGKFQVIDSPLLDTYIERIRDILIEAYLDEPVKPVQSD